MTNAAIRTLSTNMVHLSLALRPDGLEALTGGDGGRVQTWPLDLDLQQAQQQQSVQPVIPLGVATYTGHTTTTPSVAVAYADDGRLVISAGADGQLLCGTPRPRRCCAVSPCRAPESSRRWPSAPTAIRS
ncbi:MAG: hypothetical protein HND48_22135 [Chloroflexi bacterium]|nr:hypothetical protein [Chloroflexota bacterium]